MTNKNSFLTPFLMGIALTFLQACGQSESNKNRLLVDNSQGSDQTLTIDTFSTFPPEIDGCSCYFSNDSAEFKNGKYIYLNDYAQTSFLKINGVLTKFNQTELYEIDKQNTRAKYKNDDYEMTIEIKDRKQSGDETMLKTGTIKLTDKNGKTLMMMFYGECGC